MILAFKYKYPSWHGTHSSAREVGNMPPPPPFWPLLRLGVGPGAPPGPGQAAGAGEAAQRPGKPQEVNQKSRELFVAVYSREGESPLKYNGYEITGHNYTSTQTIRFNERFWTSNPKKSILTASKHNSAI